MPGTERQGIRRSPRETAFVAAVVRRQRTGIHEPAPPVPWDCVALIMSQKRLVFLPEDGLLPKANEGVVAEGRRPGPCWEPGGHQFHLCPRHCPECCWGKDQDA